MIKVYIKRICQLDPDEESKIISSLSERARARLAKKTNEELRRASLCALALLTDEQRAALDYSAEGRPSFIRLNTDVSISHSKTYVAVAISDSFRERVGLDIEDASENSRASHRFLTENEIHNFEAGTPYLEIWTKKEALFKFLKSDTAPFVQLDSARPDLYGASFTTYALDGATLTVCTLENATIDIIEK